MGLSPESRDRSEAPTLSTSSSTLIDSSVGNAGTSDARPTRLQSTKSMCVHRERRMCPEACTQTVRNVDVCRQFRQQHHHQNQQTYASHISAN